jgi:hypothetical protein
MLSLNGRQNKTRMNGPIIDEVNPKMLRRLQTVAPKQFYIKVDWGPPSKKSRARHHKYVMPSVPLPDP